MIEFIIDIADYLHVSVVAKTEERYLVLEAMGCAYVLNQRFNASGCIKSYDKDTEGRCAPSFCGTRPEG